MTPGLPLTTPRLPVITIDPCAGPRGVTALLGSEYGPHPAPFRALALKVYDVPFVSPLMSHVLAGASTKQVPPPGDAVTL
jgi:hypothetical protein